MAHRTGTPAFLMAVTLAACGAPSVAPDFQPVTADSAVLRDQLRPLGQAIGDRRIVLLGENGHGVGELTAAKVRMIEWLHREKGFDVVVMESAFFECGRAWRRATERTAREMLYDCLRYPFQQAEILPLFELIRASHATRNPLALAGMDPQAQGYDSGDRPAALHAVLSPLAPGLARRVAAFDSALFLVPESGGLGDGVYDWILEHGPAARAAYDSAASLTTGEERWAFRLAAGLVDRLSARAEAADSQPPASYYQLRDEWMARAVAALADSIAGSRKVVVWLHNDHARYGDFQAGPHRVRSVGGFLREWYGDDVYSVGFFMGRGSIADNGRRVRDVAEPPPDGIERFLGDAGQAEGYLVLTGNPSAEVRAWADSTRPYLRMGVAPMEMVPAAEFDALYYVDRVTPPTYEIPVRDGP